jgi:hypothetical protein
MGTVDQLLPVFIAGGQARRPHTADGARMLYLVFRRLRRIWSRMASNRESDRGALPPKGGFAISKSPASSGKEVFRSVSNGKFSTNVMSSNSYARASEKANKSLAGSALSQGPGKHK